MLAKIQSFYNQLLKQSEPDAEEAEHNLHLAAIALMVEVMRVDEHKSQSEIDIILQSAMSRFNVDRTEANELIALAESELQEATDYHQFTSLINSGYDNQGKLQIIEFLWEVAYADDNLDRYEEHAIRKIADLIYVSHSDFIRIKEKVRLAKIATS